MSDFRKKPRTKNILDHGKLKLSVPCPNPEAKGKKSSLAISCETNNPRISVYTNDPNDQGESKGWGKITANLDTYTYFVLMGLIRQAVAQTAEWKKRIQCLNYTWPGGKRSEAPVVVSTIHVGQDKEGIVWMSVIAPGRPPIKFIFQHPEFHFLQNSDGSPMEASESSKLYALAYVESMAQLMAHIQVKEYIEPPPKDAPGGNGGGNNYRQNSGGGGYSKPQSDMLDDDIPF